MVGYVRKLTVVRLFVDVIQAFASIVIALTLPLDERILDARMLLQKAGFAACEIDEIIRDGADVVEWAGTSDHLKAVVTGLQRDQWVATDNSTGIMAPKVGGTVGVPLAGLVACSSLSACTRRIQRRLAEEDITKGFATADAKKWLGPEGSMVWPPQCAISNFGIVGDDAFVALCELGEAQQPACRCICSRQKLRRL